MNSINYVMLFLIGTHIAFTGGAFPNVWNPEMQNFGTWLIRIFAHAGVVHLLSNLWGLFKVSSLANEYSSAKVLRLIIFLWIVSTMMLYVWNVLFLGKEKVVVGFSAVLFGLYVVYYYLQNGNIGQTLWTLVPGILPHLFIKQISFWGHLFGILSGLIYTKLFLMN